VGGGGKYKVENRKSKVKYIYRWGMRNKEERSKCIMFYSRTSRAFASEGLLAFISFSLRG